MSIKTTLIEEKVSKIQYGKIVDNKIEWGNIKEQTVVHLNGIFIEDKYYKLDNGIFVHKGECVKLIETAKLAKETVNFGDLHSFDTRLGSEAKYETIKIYDIDYTDFLYKKIENLRIEEDGKIGPLSFLSIVLSGFNLVKNKEDPSNYDPINKLSTYNILNFLAKYVKDLDNDKFNSDDLLMNFSEQIHDMYTTGQCPQGRCVRLFQIVSLFYESIENTKKL